MKQTNNKALILFFPHLFFVFLSPSVEYEMEDGELHEHGDEHDQRGCYEVMDAHPEEDIKQDDMKEIVHAMTACEPHEVLPRGGGVEGKVVRGNEVIDKTDKIACRIGDIHINP